MKLKIKLILFLFCLLSAEVSFSQKFSWVNAVVGNGYNNGGPIVVDSYKNVFTAGFFSGTADFDKGPASLNKTATGLHDMYLEKVNSAGSIVWVKTFGGSGFGNVYSLKLDDFGNIYFAGTFEGTVDFDCGLGLFNLTSKGNQDVFVCKVNSSGVFLWAKSFGGLNDDRSEEIALDRSGSVYITGGFQLLVDFNPGIAVDTVRALGYFEAFILKLDSLGNYTWVKTFNTTVNSSSFINSITVDSSNVIYTCGSLSGSGTIDFDPSAGVQNLTSLSNNGDAFICKLDSSGNYNWVKKWGGVLNDLPKKLKLDAFGNIYTIGIYQSPSTIDFDPGPNVVSYTLGGTTSSYNTFVTKWDANGNFQWVDYFGGTVGNFIPGLAVDLAGNIFLLITTGFTVDLDPGPGTYYLTQLGQDDIYLIKLTSSGNLNWVQILGGSNNDVSAGFANDVSGNLYISGSFFGSVDFDAGLGTYIINPNNTIRQNAFLLKTTCSSSTSASFNGCKLFTYNGVTYNSSGVYSVVYPKQYGCDSTVILHLSIFQSDSLKVLPHGDTLSSNEASASYQWINCSTNTIIPGATSQNYVVTSNGVYAVKVTKFGCTDTSNCFTVNYIGIEENSKSQIASIFPNPSDGRFYLKLNTKFKNASIEVYTIYGALIRKILFSDDRATIDLSNESKGMYYTCIRNEEKIVFRQKICLK